jgi:hypothetical protein
MSHLAYPVIGTAVYLYLPQNMKLNPRFLFAISILHNAFLTAFSFYTFVGLIKILRRQGIAHKHQYYFNDQDFDQYIFIFYLSKYYEYIDTLLLYLQGKKPIFLQKFHHIGAVICWHLAYFYKVDSIAFITIANSFIHTIMYAYYFISVFRVVWIRQYKIYVTSLQLIQLSLSVSLPILYYPPNETVFNYRVLLFFNAYIFCLIVLFVHFSYVNYVSCQNKKLNE